MLEKKHRYAGFTFTEILVALTLNAFLFAGLLTIFLANLKHYRQTLNADRLNQQLQMAMFIMTNDIRRAGYWNNAASDVGGTANNNPFMTTGADVTVNGSNNCILISYDKNRDGTLASVSAGSDDERYGFRLQGNVLQARPPGASFDCLAASNAWENMTDANIVQITNLTFTLNTRTITTGPGTKGISMRSVDITLTGRLTNDTSVTKTLTQHVVIRNDKYIA